MDIRQLQMPEEGSSARPLFPDIGVLALVPDSWSSTWELRHQLLSRLASYFHIVWCNPAPSWRKLVRIAEYRRKNADDYCDQSMSPSFTVYQPERWLPLIGRPVLIARWTMRERLRRAKALLADRGCSKTILYVWRPEFGPAMSLIDYDLSCYHIDDEYTFSEIDKPISQCEARLISSVDQVFIHSPALLEKKGMLNHNTVFVPNGVDFYAYSTVQSEPSDLKEIPHPRIGYVGVIKKQLDFELLIALTRRHPQWSFVFVGPHGNLDGRATLIDQLARLSNVYFMGYKPVRMLAAYTQHLDVCMLCYVVNDYTKYIYPLKLHECLASGRPAVATPIRSLQEFSHVIRLARTVEEWSHAIRDSLSPYASSETQVKERQGIARQYDWNRLVRLVAYNLCSRLGPQYVERFDTIMISDPP